MIQSGRYLLYIILHTLMYNVVMRETMRLGYAVSMTNVGHKGTQVKLEKIESRKNQEDVDAFSQARQFASLAY